MRAAAGPWAGATSLPVTGYEIHMGQHAGEGASRPLLSLDGRPDGAVSPDGRIAGTYLHGLLHNDGVRAALLRALGRSHDGAAGMAFAERREAAFDRLAAVVREHLDLRARRGAPRALTHAEAARYGMSGSYSVPMWPRSTKPSYSASE